MKTNRSLRSLLVLSSLALVPALAMASHPIPNPTPGGPSALTVDVSCPGVHGVTNVITNFGDYVGGYGVEYIMSQPGVPAYFTSPFLPPTVPSSLVYYFNETANYDSKTGIVSCTYLSSLPTEPGFSVAYYVTNGRGGAINTQTASTVEIIFPFGLMG